MTSMARQLLFLLAVAAPVACRGPRLHVHNPEGHLTFVDGVETKAASLPFRYYGTTRWDALPKDVDQGRGLRPDWSQRPTSWNVEVPWPASPLLFPLDLPLELASWLLGGRTDTTTTVSAAPVSAADVPTAAALRERADAARALR
jgi:hypothetical protein